MTADWERFMSVLAWTTGLARVFAVFTCNHGRVHGTEGKTYCPDCGRGILLRWVVLRCEGCGQRRPGHYRFRHVIPTDAHCIACGHTGVERHYLIEPEFYQLRHALLSFEPEPSDEGENHLTAWFHRTWQNAFTQPEATSHRVPLLLSPSG